MTIIRNKFFVLPFSNPWIVHHQAHPTLIKKRSVW